MITLNKSRIGVIMLAAFVVVAALSFLHFYSMIYGDLGNMQSHAPCQTYLQISTALPPNTPCLAFLIMLFITPFVLFYKILRVAPKRSFLISHHRFRFIKYIKTNLIFPLLFRKGILNSRLYA